MSWLEKIGIASPAKPAAPAAVPPNQQNLQAANPGDNSADPTAGKPLEKVDPLAQFKMWDTVKTDPLDKAPEFVLDDTALDGAVSKLDFMQGLDPAVRALAESGDSKALMQALAHGNANAYKHAMKHSSTLTGRFTEARETYRDKSFGTKVRGELTADAMADTPNYSNPTVKKQLGIWATELQRQHPDASPKEIAGMAKDYLAQLSGSVLPTKAPAKAKGAPGSTNWDSYFDGAEEESQDDRF